MVWHLIILKTWTVKWKVLTLYLKCQFGTLGTSQEQDRACSLTVFETIWNYSEKD